MNLELSPQDRAFALSVRHFFENEYPASVREKIRSGQRLSKQDHILSQQALQSRGWLGMGWTREHGGPGWTEVQRYLFESELERAGAANIIPMGVIYIGPILIHFGTPQQQQRWLPNILNSSEFWAQGYSEPESGSDLASLSMSAVHDGDDYILNGSKIWTTLGHWADWIFCLVRTSKETRKQAGISFVCVDMRSPGVEVHPIIAMNGAHELNRVSFDNVRVPVANRIGEEGKGWHYANVLLGSERLSYAHIGKKKADMRRLRQLASQAPADGGGCLIDESLTAAKLAALDIRIDCIEVSVLRALCGEMSAAAISALKIACTECAQAITELHVELAGPAAAAFPDLNDAQWAAKLSSTPSWAVTAVDGYLFERAQSIYGGTNEIQRNIIWKALNR